MIRGPGVDSIDAKAGPFIDSELQGFQVEAMDGS